jgi:hypothetical protein
VAALGYDRALDYVWSGAYEFPVYVRVVRQANLPISSATRIIHLAAETAERASMIHHDGALTLEQKRAAMSQLQEKVQIDFDVLLPKDVQEKLPPQSLTWISGLSEGRYRFVVTTLGANAGSILNTGTSVDTPVAGGGPWRSNQVLPKRPAGE